MGYKYCWIDFLVPVAMLLVQILKPQPTSVLPFEALASTILQGLNIDCYSDL